MDISPSPDTPRPPAPPETPIDAGSQALSEALRSSFGIVKVVMVVLICVFLGSGFFTVGPQERAIKIRLGKPVGEGERALLGPGLHWSFPYPIEEYKKVPITAIQKVTSTVGWFATTPEEEQAGIEPAALSIAIRLNPLVDGSALTADRNIIHTRATLTYHIADPVAFVFNFVNASNMVQAALDNALLCTASKFKVDDILTHDITGFKVAVQRRVTELVKRQELGIEVEECLVQSRAPRQLKDAFDSVLRAEVTRGKVHQDALDYENQVLLKASGEAKAYVETARSERAMLVKEVTGDAQRFKDLLPKYRANPALFAQQRLTETLGRVFTNAQDKIFITDAAGSPRELRLLLNRDAPKKKTEEPTP